MTSASLFDKPIEGFAELRVFHSLVYLLDKLFCRFFVHFHTAHNTSLQNRKGYHARFSKGQDSLLSHSMLIAFSLIVIIFVVAALTSLRDDYSGFIGKNEISQVCLLVKGSIEKIFVEDRYSSPTNTTKGRIFLNLPDRIGDQNYRIRFVNASISIETLSRPRVNDTCKAGFNLSYTGSTTGGRTEINFTVRDSGEKIVSIKKV